MAGVIIAGTLVADCIKMIDHYPKKGMFADISDVSYGVGGCAANTAVGVKALDPSIEVKSVALVGKDANGAFVKRKLEKHGIDISMIQETDKDVTGFSDVMTVKHTGERTFFSDRGVNRIFDEKNLQIEDGWMYFIYGWTQVMADVYHQELLGEKLKVLSDIAMDVQKKNK